MASLAPGNGWYPTRNPERSQLFRRGINAVRIETGGDSNVYAFPPSRTLASSRPVKERGVLAGAFNAWVARAGREGHGASWIIGWCVFGLALASMAWITMIGALFAAAVLSGVPWLTAALAFGAAHLLAAALAALAGVRMSRALLPSPHQPPQ